MNIFRFPRTAEAVRSHIRGRVPQSLRFGAAAAIFTLAFGLSLPAMARAPVATANAEIARCIRSAAHGKPRSEEHTSELQSLMRISYAVFCLEQNKLPREHLYFLQNVTEHDYTSNHN